MYESAERHLTGYRYGQLTNATELDLIDTDNTKWPDITHPFYSSPADRNDPRAVGMF